ncbi:MAG: choice-of-anchor J domain-containing protein [Prevotella sp.]|nr:choice-of-anchor J domain-containing protein [Prevotella sp.]MCM1075482.1 choice-of-anchor J domain-containing protein [Ruminococcus sp.]
MKKLLLTMTVAALAGVSMSAQEQRALPSGVSADSLALPRLYFYPQDATATPAALYAPPAEKGSPKKAPSVKKGMKPSFGVFTDEPDMPRMFGFNWTAPWTIMQIDRPDMTETNLLDATDWPVTVHLRNGNIEGSYFQDNQGGTVLMQASYTANGLQNWRRTQFVSKDEYGKRPVRTAYDPHSDMMYGLSVMSADNKDKFGFVKFPADTRIDPKYGNAVQPFENIQILNGELPPSCECSAMAWDPRDGNVIGISIQGEVIRFNTADGSYKVLFNTGLVNSIYFGGLAYSPEDRGFIWVYLTRDESGATVSQDWYLINTDAKTCKLLKSIPKGPEGLHQVSSLIINENYLDPLAPTVPKLAGDTFAEYAGEGTISVEIPTHNSKGLPLSGALNYYLRVDGITSTDGKSYVEATVKPGEVRTDKISGLTDGMHRLTVYVVTADGHWSQPLNITKFAGYDTPETPTDVTLDAETLSWTPVTTGVHGVSISASDIEYELRVDGELIGTTSETSYPMSFDKTELLSHLAAVSAVCHGKKSPLSYSNRVTVGEYRSVPATFVPTASDIILSTVVDKEADDYTWYYNEYNGAYYKNHGSNSRSDDDWLFLPPVNFDDPDALYEISYELLTKNYDESLELRLCDEPVADTGEVILANTLNTTLISKDFVKVTGIISASGVKHLAFHPGRLNSDIYVRNINVTRTGSTTSAPAAVADLQITPGAKGAIPCTATFTLPTTNMKGNPLPADADLTATLRGVYKNFTAATATGKPGQKVSVEFIPGQGRADVFVQTSLRDNVGGLAQGSVWAGVDVPAHVKNLRVTLDENPMSVHIDFDAPGETGYHGGYADPTSTVFYLLAKKSGASKWTRFDPVDYTEIRLDLNSNYGQQFTEFAVMTENAAGASNTWDAVDIVCGEAYKLPLRESLPGGYPEYSPIVTETPTDEYIGSCGFADPAALKPEYAVPGNTVIGMMPPADGSAGKAMVCFPLFSTEGATRPAFVAQALLDKELTARADVYAVAYGQEPVKIGSWDAETPGEGYTSLCFPLPQSMLDKKWVKVYVDASFESGENRRFVVMQRYSVTDLKDNDFSLLSVTAPTFIRINRDAALKAVVCNNSAEAKAAPELTINITDCNGVSTTATATPSNTAPIGVDEEHEYIIPIKAGADELGEMKFAISLPDDEVLANNRFETSSTVQTGDAIICTDIKAVRDASDKSIVNLTWNEPTIFTGTEDIESMSSFDSGKYLGSFFNLDLDGSQTYTWENWDFPGEEDPHAFIVFDDTWPQLPADNEVLKAYSGHKFLMALAPLNYVTAHDWLISPEVEPGTDVSFMLNTISTYYGDDYVGLFYSEGSTNPDDFEMLLFKRKNTEGWEEVSATLPDNARRFAIQFYSNDTFGIMIDDISYTPEGGLATLEGFDIERDGTLLHSYNTAAYSHTDSGVDENEHYYHVYPTLLASDGSRRRGEASPTARVDKTSGLDSMTASGISVKVAGHNVYVTGLEGRPAILTDASGMTIPAATATPESATFSVSTGVYMLSTGNNVHKIMVR